MGRIFELIVQLAWPALIASLAYYFRNPLRAILEEIPKALGRVQSLDAFGVKANMLEQERAVIQATTQAVAESGIRLDLPAVYAGSDASVTAESESYSIQSASVDPRARIVELSAQIERELSILASTLGILGSRASILSLLKAISAKIELPQFLLESLRAFVALRNTVVHQWDTSDVSKEAIGSGEEILRLLKQIPRAGSTIVKADIPLYSDGLCSKPYQGIHGVIVENRGPDGVPGTLVLYPTARKYKEGDVIILKWDMSTSAGPIYFKDPFTGDTIRMAFSSAACIEGDPL